MLVTLPISLRVTNPHQALEKELLFTNGKNVYNIDGLTLRTNPHPTPTPSLAYPCHGATCSGYTYSGHTYYYYYLPLPAQATTCAPASRATSASRPRTAVRACAAPRRYAVVVAMGGRQWVVGGRGSRW